MINYKRLRVEEREEISRLLMLDKSLRGIACLLGRSPSTVCREVNRYRLGRAAYRAIQCQSLANQVPGT